MTQSFFYRVFSLLSRALNTFTGGYPDETFSARVYRNAVLDPVPPRWLWSALHKGINRFFRLVLKEEDHCLDAFITERDNLNRPEVYHTLNG